MHLIILVACNFMSVCKESMKLNFIKSVVFLKFGLIQMFKLVFGFLKRTAATQYQVLSLKVWFPCYNSGRLPSWCVNENFFFKKGSILNNCHFYYKGLLYMILQSSRCLEVHSNSWLSDLKVGKATKILKDEGKVLIWNMVGQDEVNLSEYIVAHQKSRSTMIISIIWPPRKKKKKKWSFINSSVLRFSRVKILNSQGKSKHCLHYCSFMYGHPSTDTRYISWMTFPMCHLLCEAHWSTFV